MLSTSRQSQAAEAAKKCHEGFQNKCINTDEAVAYGAAVQAGILSNVSGQAFLLLDVAPSRLASNCRRSDDEAHQ